MTAREKFQQLTRGFVKPALTLVGLRARGQTYYKFEHGNWGLVQLQTHRLSSSNSVVFTVNVAVASARLSSIPADQWRKLPPREYACDLRMRIGLLLPSGRDKWWTIDASTNVTELAREVVGDIKKVGLPALERYMSDEALRDLCLSGGGWLTEFERTPKLTTLLRAIGPPEGLPSVESEAAVAASLSTRAARVAEIGRVLLESGFRPAGDDTFVAPTSTGGADAPNDAESRCGV